jgi:hypothetical protein
MRQKRRKAANPVWREKLQRDIIYWGSICQSFPGQQSISFLVQNLRREGWSLPGTLHDCELLLSEAGFKVRYRYSKPNSRGNTFLEATYILMYCPLQELPEEDQD